MKGQRVEHRVPDPPRVARRHCWVTGSDDAPGPHAGIVLGWERRGERWFAQVAYVIEGARRSSSSGFRMTCCSQRNA
jgi:hypothetical protein